MQFQDTGVSWRTRHHRAGSTTKPCGCSPRPAIRLSRTKHELRAHWGRAWGIDNDVGRIRSVLMHRPGAEMAVVDPTKRIEAIGSFGDLKEGWYFQSDSVPPLPEMQAQHDALVAALEVAGRRDRVMSTAIPASGSNPATRAIPSSWSRAAPSSAGWERASGVAKNLPSPARWPSSAIPILRTLSGTALMEGGSFAWINATYRRHRLRNSRQSRRCRAGRRGAEAAGRRTHHHRSRRL